MFYPLADLRLIIVIVLVSLLRALRMQTLLSTLLSIVWTILGDALLAISTQPERFVIVFASKVYATVTISENGCNR